MGNALSQTLFIPTPGLTEQNLPDQTGKVHIVTGGYAGCGQELAKILYQRNATVYVAGRSAEKAKISISAIKAEFPKSNGRLEFLSVDFADLSSIKPAVESFLSRETRLDTITNNAGVMTPPVGSKDKQGYELQMGTNCLGPFLFSKLLVPILQRTASSAPTDSVRVTWASSLAAEIDAPPGGVKWEDDGSIATLANKPRAAYGQSKAANTYLASEFARHYSRDTGIVSVSWHPGMLTSELQRHMSPLLQFIVKMLAHPAKFGAYTELYSGWSPEITSAQNGAYVVPWGRIGKARGDIITGMKSKSEGGTGVAERFWDWCENETSKYA